MSETESIDGILRREFAAELTAVEGRTIDVRIVPYGERISHNDGLGPVPMGVFYDEEWLPGVFSHQMNAAFRVHANVEHEEGINGKVGHGVALREAADGFHGSFVILETPAGETALQLIKAGALDGVSLEAKPVRNIVKGSLVQRAKAHLRDIALTRFAAFSGARILAVREEALTVDRDLLPAADMDEGTIERLRALGVRLPDRYQAHPDTDSEHPADGGTLAVAAPAPTTENDTVEG